MKQTRLQQLYGVLLVVIFGGIVLHAPLSVGFGTLFPDHALLIKSWKEILMLLLIPLAIIIVSRRQLWPELARDWIFRLIVIYTALHVVLAIVFYQGAAATAAGLAIDLRYILFFGLVYVLIRTAPHYRKLMIRIGIIGACIVVGFATLQLFLPVDSLKHIGYSNQTIAPYLTVDKNPDYIRVNSTLRGPNPLGAYAGIVLALVIAALVCVKVTLYSRRRQIGVGILALCSLVALWISYSRSALVAAVVAVGLVVALTVGRRLTRRSWIISLAVIGVVIGGLLVGQNSSFVSNVILHENPADGNAINSNEAHFDSLRTGTERLLQQPLGAGVGSTGSASLQGKAPIIIENQYLFTAHETGWLGLGLFVFIFGLISMRLWQQRRDWLALGVFCSGVGLALIGLLLPVWVDDTVAIVWWGLAAIALAKVENND